MLKERCGTDPRPARIDVGSEVVHLGVFADNVPGKRLYERLGFAFVGEPGPDMLLVG